MVFPERANRKKKVEKSAFSDASTALKRERGSWVSAFNTKPAVATELALTSFHHCI